ncbi:hypothetical protein [Nostoc sp.]|uniref:hypothetical protein n=1 Tax=Nostoc sp. TaxID=1180 RepID=UPI002FF67100
MSVTISPANYNSQVIIGIKLLHRSHCQHMLSGVNDRLHDSLNSSYLTLLDCDRS